MALDLTCDRVWEKDHVSHMCRVSHNSKVYVASSSRLIPRPLRFLCTVCKNKGGGKAWCILSCKWCHCPPISRWTEKRKGPNCLAVSVQGVGALNICKVKNILLNFGNKNAHKFFLLVGDPSPGRQWCHSLNTHQKCLSYRVVGCLLFRGCLSIEVNGRTVGSVHYILERCPLLRGVHYWEVSTTERCPLLRGVNYWGVSTKQSFIVKVI